jgi:hypothetical protein
MNRSEQISREISNETPSPEPSYSPASILRIEVGQELEFGTDKENHPLTDNRALISGWSAPESGGIWSLGKDAAIGFVVHCEPAVCAKKDATLLFEGMAYGAAGHLQQTIEVWIRNRKVDQVTLSNSLTKFSIVLNGVTIEDGAPIILSLHLPDAIVPAGIMNLGDPRELAFRIKSLRLNL